jgi:hypothetical protein
MNVSKRPNFSSLKRWRSSVDDGRTWCRKHLSHTYDPTKHDGCFLCYIERHGLVGCDYCQYGYRKPEFDKCYHCFKRESGEGGRRNEM